MPSHCVVLINHWGGLPGSLMPTVAARQRAWACTVDEAVVLPRTDPGLSFRALVGGERDAVLSRRHPAPRATLFTATRDAGYRVVILGPTGLLPRASHASRGGASHLPDPREALADWGIDRCALHDGEAFAGRASAYDEETLAEARRILRDRDDDPSSAPLILWVNLLSARDLTRVRFRPASEGAPPVVVARAHVSVDARLVPPSVHASLPGDLTPRLAALDRLRHGEAEGAGPLRARERDGEYGALLSHATECLDGAARRGVDTLLRDALQGGDCAVAHFASHALSLGEHGVRGGNAPTSVCCEGFWSSNCPNCPDDDLHDHDTLPTLEARLTDFLRVACGLALPPETVVPCTVGLLPDGLLVARVVVLHHDHAYACVLLSTDPEHPRTTADLVGVYDLSVDPGETDNVLKAVAHLQLNDAARCLLPERGLVVRRLETKTTPRTVPVPPPQAVPAHSVVTLANATPKSLPVLKPTPGPVVHPPVPVPAPAAFEPLPLPLSAPRAPSPTPTEASSTSDALRVRRATSVRVKESRLHSMHR